MKIHTLKVNNFKSYKGKHVIGPFTEFTAVIGTNASGKSNCFDAICFVLGASSNSLRCKDLSELLYKGSECTKTGYVQMTLATEYGTKVKFKREISGNSCTYSVNKENVTRQEYREQLKSHGFHQNFQSYILFQGEIGTMATMKPKALTQLIENLSGSNQMKDSYERLEKELNDVSKQTKESFHLYEDLSSKFDSLKDNIDTVNLYRQYTAEKNEAEQSLTNFLLYFNTCLYKNKNDELSKFKDEYDHMKNDSDALAEGISAQSSIIKTAKNALQQEEKKFKLITQKLTDLKTELDIMNAEISQKEENDKSLHEEEKQIAEQVKDETTMMKQLNQEIRSFEKDNKIILENIVQIRKVIQDYNNATFTSPESLMKKQEYDKSLLKQNMAESNYKRVCSQLESAVLLLKATEHNHQSENDQEIKEPDKEEYEKFIISKQNEKEKLEMELQECAENLSKISKHNTVSKKKEEQNQVLQRLQSQFKGVYGFVRDLYRPIRMKYDISIKAALGFHLDQVIVDSFDTAINCIQFLKANNLGKLTFLPIDSIQQKLQMKEKNSNSSFRTRSRNAKSNVTENTNQNYIIPLLFDFIDCEEHIKPIYQFCLNQIYLCEDKDIIEEVWATKRYKRLINLEGTIYKQNGCITGGQFQDTSNSISRLSIEHLESEYNSIKEKIRNIEKEINDKQKQFDDQNKLFMDYQSKQQIYNLKIQQINEEIDERTKEKQEKESLLDIARNECSRSKQILEEINIQENNKRKEIIQDITNQNKDLIELFNDVSTINDLIKLEEEFSIKEKENSEKKAQIAYFESASAASKLKTMKDQIKESKKSLQELKKKFKEKEDAMQDMDRSEYQHIKDDVDQARSNVSQAEEKKKQMIEENKKMKKQLTEHNKQIQNKEKVIAQLLDTITDIFTHSSNMFDSIDEVLRSDFSFIPQNEQQIAATLFNPNENTGRTRSQARSRQNSGSNQLTNKAVTNYINQLKEKITSIENKIIELGEPNFKAEEEAVKIKQKKKEAKQKAKELRDKQRVTLYQFQDVKRKRKETFVNALQKARQEVALVYSTLTQTPTQPLGGTAFLSSEKDDLPFAGGTIFSVIPPHKKERQLDTLSGGEQTLAIVALAFALNKIAPAPIFVLDEIDSALDIRNVTKLAEFLASQKSKQRQIIMISHKPNVFWLCETLIGVTKRSEIGSNTYRLSLQNTKKTKFRSDKNKKQSKGNDSEHEFESDPIGFNRDENENKQEAEYENDEPPSLRIAGF